MNLSCNLNNFRKAIPPYKNTIKQSGYKNDLTFSETQPKKKKNAKSYGSICLLITMLSITLEGLKLIDKHFPPEHKLHKILNRNIKINYSCMPNIEELQPANKKLLKETSQQSKP